VPVLLQTSEGAEAGVVTSMAFGSPRASALGFLRLEFLKEGRPVTTPRGTELRPIDTDTEEGIYT
jgi:hypothetical protein